MALVGGSKRPEPDPGEGEKKRTCPPHEWYADGGRADGSTIYRCLYCPAQK